MDREQQIAAVRELQECHHIFFTPEGMDHFTEPFGFKGETNIHYANPNDPKGLTLADGAEFAEGAAAENIAAQICRHLGVPYENKIGRGFQLRACCDALLKHLEALGVEIEDRSK